MKNSNNTKSKRQEEEQNPEFSKKVEDTFRLVMRILSAIIGIAIAAILIFPIFEVSWLDVLTTQILRAGLISLVLVLLIELFARRVKSLLSKIL